jgi:hypothetical protein
LGAMLDAAAGRKLPGRQAVANVGCGGVQPAVLAAVERGGLEAAAQKHTATSGADSFAHLWFERLRETRDCRHAHVAGSGTLQGDPIVLFPPSRAIGTPVNSHSFHRAPAGR